MDGSLGLRERKRLAAMRRIQEVALDLFDAYGYEHVPIERIAEEAEVSPSSIYRYFGTKEQIVLWDEYDPMAFARLPEELREHPPIEALRRTVLGLVDAYLDEDESYQRRRMGLAMTEPALQAATALQTQQMSEIFAAILARGLDRDLHDLDVRLLAHAFAGATLGALRHWYEADFAMPLRDILERVFESFEEGFTLTR